MANMDENQVRMIVQQEMKKADASNRFRLTPTNRHIHNNVDAPYVFLPYAVFGGFVPYDAALGGILESIMPKGWTVQTDGTGSYRIFHNLGTTNYAFVANATQSTNQVVIPVVSPFADEVDVIWFDTGVTEQDTSFNFVLVQFNNRSDTFPTYVTNHVQ